MKKIITLIIIFILFITTCTATTTFASSFTNVQIELNKSEYVVGDTIIAKVQLNIDEPVTSCGVEYLFDNTVLSFNENESYWTSPGLLQSLKDFQGNPRAVWTLPQGVNFFNNKDGILILAFKINKLPEMGKTTINFNIKAKNNNINESISTTINVLPNTETPNHVCTTLYLINNNLYHWYECFDCHAKINYEAHNYFNNYCLVCGQNTNCNYVYINKECHLSIFDNFITISNHLLDLNGDCIFCLHHIEDTADIVIADDEDFIIIEVEEPGEPTTDEEEDYIF